jgi:hypothetical protein
MADQNERAYQKQPTINLNKKGGLKANEARFVCNPGLGFKVPAEARTGNYIDKKCPFVGKVWPLLGPIQPNPGLHPRPRPDRGGGQAQDEPHRRDPQGLPALRQEIQPVCGARE